MDVTREELLLLTEELAARYLNHESSSVTYETAQMLMAAVQYCLQEYEEGRGESARLVPAPSVHQPIREAYQEGYERLLKKVRRAKDYYDLILKDFISYDCINYKSTLLDGMPSFFLYYDPRFCPQNHILTLDYPIIGKLGAACGADLIEAYLMGVLKEKELLSYFEPGRIVNLLNDLMPDGGGNYMDNICEAVLNQAAVCFITDREVSLLTSEQTDTKVITAYFDGQDLDQAEHKVAVILRLLIRSIRNQTDECYEKYFVQLSRSLAVRFLSLRRIS